MYLAVGYHFGGMHFFWWFLWIIFLLWIFASPYHVPFQEKKKSSPLNILKNRLATGQITNEEYLEKKKLLEQSLNQ